MTDDPKKPQSPWALNSSRIVLLILGALLAVYIASTLLGGLGNYQQLRDAALDAKATAQPEAKP